MIKHIEYLFNSERFVSFISQKLLDDRIHIIRMSFLKTLIELKDFIGIKVFQKNILNIFFDMGQSTEQYKL